MVATNINTKVRTVVGTYSSKWFYGGEQSVYTNVRIHAPISHLSIIIIYWVFCSTFTFTITD